MSYDFTMFKPRGTINSMAEIEPANLRLQDGDAIKTKLTALFPAIEWEDKGDRGWLGRLEADGTWYEFRIPAGDDECWNVATSEGNEEAELIVNICASLQLLAFDGQALTLIDANGRRSAI